MGEVDRAVEEARPRRRWSPRDLQGVGAGLFFLAVGLLAYQLGAHLPVGRALRMGPGYLPQLLAWIVGGLGVVILVQALFVRGPRIEPLAFRPLVIVCGSVLVFAALIERAGLAITSVALIALSSLAAPDRRWGEVALFAAAMTIFAVLVFPVGLGLVMPVWPR